MTTRLDRLVLLLDTGAPVVRSTAAEQLAQVQKKHPHELFNLLGRIVPYLRSKQWESRTAAARALGGILDNVQAWQPNEPDAAGGVVLDGPETAAAADVKIDPQSDLFDIDKFDILAVVRNGKTLVGSGGQQYDVDVNTMSAEERLARAKHNVTARLGLGGEYIDKDFLSATDVGLGAGTAPTGAKFMKQKDTPGTPASDVTTPGTPSEGLSARQRNMMKRKAKLTKQSSSKIRLLDLGVPTPVHTNGDGRDEDGSENDDSAAPLPGSGAQASGQDYFSLTMTKQPQDETKVVVEVKAPQPEVADFFSPATNKIWPLGGLLDVLLLDIFDVDWETRHGAAMGLRELMRSHADDVGRIVGVASATNNLRNSQATGDMACRLCCLFALDRFGDYVADQVVAPIRESVAQALAALLRHADSELTSSIFALLRTLVLQPDVGRPAWEVTHGGMLGLRYLVAVCRDTVLASPTMLDGTLACVLEALESRDDDVKAVGAATLLPIVDNIVVSRPHMTEQLLDILWDCLADLGDDLSSSTGSILDLLAKLCAIPDVLSIMQAKSDTQDDRSFRLLVPRLYPFLRHTITSVRRSVLRALETLLHADAQQAGSWIDGRFLQLLLQNILLEQNAEVLDASQKLWKECCLHAAQATGAPLRGIVCRGIALATTAIGHARHHIPLDTSLMIKPSGLTYSMKSNTGTTDEPEPAVGTRRGRIKKPLAEKHDFGAAHAHNIDAAMALGDTELIGHSVLLRARLATSAAIGYAAALLQPAERLSFAIDSVFPYLVAMQSTSRMLAAVVLQELAAQASSDMTLMTQIRARMEAAMCQRPPEQYANLINSVIVVRSQTQALCNTFLHVAHLNPEKVPIVPEMTHSDGSSGYSVQTGSAFLGELYDRMERALGHAYKGTLKAQCENAKQSLQNAVDFAIDIKSQEDVRIAAAYGAVAVAVKELPKKLNPVIKSLMDAIKTESEELLQGRAAAALASLIELCFDQNRTGPAEKLVKNICAFSCADVALTPEFEELASIRDRILTCCRDDGTARSVSDDPSVILKRRGAEFVLAQFASRFGTSLLTSLPIISEAAFGPLSRQVTPLSDPVDLDVSDPVDGQQIIDSLSLITSIVSKYAETMPGQLLAGIPLFIKSLKARHSSIRFSAARAMAAICKTDPLNGLGSVISSVLPMLGDAGSPHRRQGGIELLHMLVQTLDIQILPYIIFLIVPALGRMSDPNNDIRILATTTFASLVKLVPLEAGMPDPPGFSAELLAERDEERKFIQQMLDGSKVETFEIPVAIKADLRSYQQDGVNWLAFLNRYQLHGILCDDMGLGKTLQSICILASDHHNRAVRFKKDQSPEHRRLPSIVVCPPSLSGHWSFEIQTYAPFMRCCTYVGLPHERQALRKRVNDVDVVITSYDVARNDSDFLSSLDWNYCILDEGHMIKNSKAKITQAVKRLRAAHRLILSGTPIQNNVLELWSLFDFLMPGFLGTEKSFHERYAKPIANSRESKSSSKEQEAGALALEALHKQVLPFLLRRLKEDVLHDLPPKIIQDYYCDLSDLQKALYNDFKKSQAVAVVHGIDESKKSKDGQSHIFQALQYMRKLCDHPALVLNDKHPKYASTKQRLTQQGSSIRDIAHAPKLLALKDLLIDCGISTGGVAGPTGGDVVSQHRALIFCQLKEMLDMVEKDVLKALLPDVTYMRLDGSTDPRDRQGIVQQFNADPSIDVLLLTTHVGGLGLNLTGADTVIFVEHDWNPMKDLQAMDRAHRIGQKKVVNVYRLITRNTLEEKIMGLQKFKMNIASTVVNQQNSGLATMGTDQLLDLFDAKGDEKADASSKVAEANGLDSQGNVLRPGDKAVFDQLEELYTEDQYQEYDNLDDFVARLK